MKSINKTSIWSTIKAVCKSGFGFWLLGVQLIAASFCMRASSVGYNYHDTVEVIMDTKGITAKEKLAMIKALRKRSYSLYYEVVTSIVEDDSMTATEKIKAIKSLKH